MICEIVRSPAHSESVFHSFPEIENLPACLTQRSEWPKHDFAGRFPKLFELGAQNLRTGRVSQVWVSFGVCTLGQTSRQSLACYEINVENQAPDACLPATRVLVCPCMFVRMQYGLRTPSLT